MISVNNISKKFENKVVLNSVNLEIESGQTVVILGKSGSGKSVLLKCITRLMEPDSGEILINNENILKYNHARLNEVRKKMGFLFQSGALYDSMNVHDNLAFPLSKHTKLSKDEIHEKVVEVLEWVDLVEAIKKMPSELSGGMRKRIALARALITKPEIMLYDEPTTGLDPITTKEITELIVNMQNKFKMTSIVVTHDLIVLRGTADKTYILKDGNFIFSGTNDELEKSSDPFIVEFISNQPHRY